MSGHKRSSLNQNEQLLIDYIKKDPYISQQDLAYKLDLSRPSVANLISGLVKKGYIRGKAYVLNEMDQIICIGGANLDRKFYIDEELKPGTSNPVHSTQNAGGVARNIGENLGRMGKDVTLLTVSGLDAEWSFIEKASAAFMNTEHVIHLPNEATGSYTAVLDRTGELVIALADMNIYDFITPEIVKEKLPLLSQSRCLIVDMNCPKDTLEFLGDFARSKSIPLVLIAVSAPKMARLPQDLSGFSWIVTNRDETEGYFSMDIKDKEQWEQSVDQWLSKGIDNVVVTNGDRGVMIGNREEGVFHIPAHEVNNVEDVTGAGDAFTAAAIYAWLDGKNIVDIAKLGIINAAKTLQSPYTVRQDLSAENIQKDLEELS